MLPVLSLPNSYTFRFALCEGDSFKIPFVLSTVILGQERGVGSAPGIKGVEYQLPMIPQLQALFSRLSLLLQWLEPYLDLLKLIYRLSTQTPVNWI